VLTNKTTKRESKESDFLTEATCLWTPVSAVTYRQSVGFLFPISLNPRSHCSVMNCAGCNPRRDAPYLVSLETYRRLRSVYTAVWIYVQGSFSLPDELRSCVTHVYGKGLLWSFPPLCSRGISTRVPKGGRDYPRGIHGLLFYVYQDIVLWETWPGCGVDSWTASSAEGKNA
jgi:hypothetical protein